MGNSTKPTGLPVAQQVAVNKVWATIERLEVMGYTDSPEYIALPNGTINVQVDQNDTDNVIGINSDGTILTG